MNSKKLPPKQKSIKISNLAELDSLSMEELNQVSGGFADATGGRNQFAETETF